MGLGIKNYTATRYSINRMEKSQKTEVKVFVGNLKSWKKKLSTFGYSCCCDCGCFYWSWWSCLCNSYFWYCCCKTPSWENKCYWCGLCFLHKILLIRAGTRNAWEIYNSMYNIYWDFYENLSENENGFRSNYLTSRNVTQGGRSLFFIW